MYIGVVGDFHIPGRKREIPRELLAILKEKQVERILCTGDLTTLSSIKILKEISPVECVRGEMDFLSLPTNKILDIGNFKFGLIHGNPTKEYKTIDDYIRMFKEMNVNVLIYGHTHKQQDEIISDIVVLNPGSATGAWGIEPEESYPSFQILDILPSAIEVENYIIEPRHLRIKRNRYTY